jgi:hypothetical protein
MKRRHGGVASPCCCCRDQPSHVQMCCYQLSLFSTGTNKGRIGSLAAGRYATTRRLGLCVYEYVNHGIDELRASPPPPWNEEPRPALDDVGPTP